MRSLTKIYLEAARIVAEQETEFSCLAVTEAADFEGFNWWTCPKVQRYGRVFGEPRSLANEIVRIHLSEERERSLRVLMLCLMAACWRDFK